MISVLLILMVAIVLIWPWGMPTADRYFDPIGERELQEDETGQLGTNIDEYHGLSLSGADFKG